MTITFDRALLFASKLHCGQLRKGGEVPYLAHLMAVCALVLEHGGSEVEAIAALLHDAAEDQGGEATLTAIEQRFGAPVARLVRECSDSLTPTKPPWRERKEAYLARLPYLSASAKLVLTANKLHNLRTTATDLQRMGPIAWGKFNGKREGSLWYYRSMAAALAVEAAGTKREWLTRELSELVERVSLMT